MTLYDTVCNRFFKVEWCSAVRSWPAAVVSRSSLINLCTLKKDQGRADAPGGG